MTCVRSYIEDVRFICIEAQKDVADAIRKMEQGESFHVMSNAGALFAAAAVERVFGEAYSLMVIEARKNNGTLSVVVDELTQRADGFIKDHASHPQRGGSQCEALGRHYRARAYVELLKVFSVKK